MTSVLSLIMQWTSLPISTCYDLDNLNKDFLLVSSYEKWKLHALSWEVVTLPKQKSSMGISLLIEKSQSMITNFAWEEKIRCALGKAFWIKHTLTHQKSSKSMACTWNVLTQWLVYWLGIECHICIYWDYWINPSNNVFRQFTFTA